MTIRDYSTPPIPTTMSSRLQKTSACLAVALATLGASSWAAAEAYEYRVPARGARLAVQPGPFSFGTCGATGAYGPTLAQCETAYSGSALSGTVSIAPSQGIQSWVVPKSGTYTVRIAGAAGGSATGFPEYTKGLGALFTTQLALTQGTTIQILVGQIGLSAHYDGGGGGGSYVAVNGVPLAVAGAGGAAALPGAMGSGLNASLSVTPVPVRATGGYWGGGGSGFSVNGYNDVRFGGQSYSFLQGGAGGGFSNEGGPLAQALGGFGGGGGGGYNGAGGGGGYTPSGQAGGGGNSYSASAITAAAASNAGDGYVIFTLK